LQDLEAALRNDQQALDLTVEGHPSRPDLLLNLGASFEERYKRLGSLHDLDTAVQYNKEALAITPKGPDRPTCLQMVSQSLGTRYSRLGALPDLQDALQFQQEAISLTTDFDPLRPEQLHTLLCLLRDRFARFKGREDIEEAVQTAEQALTLTPKDHPTRPKRLEYLSIVLRDLYLISKDPKDLKTALLTAKEGLYFTPPDHPERANLLQSVAMCFGSRYYTFGKVRDLDTAMKNYAESFDLTPDEHPDLLGRLRNLASIVGERYWWSGDITDINTAIQLSKTALDLMSDNHPNRAGHLSTHAEYLKSRYVVFQDSSDLEDMHYHFSDSVNLPTSTPELSWNTAVRWASYSTHHTPSSSTCVTAYTAAFRLLPDILWMGHSVSQRHETIRRLEIGAVTSTAVQACITCSDVTSAVEFIEYGVATIFQQMLQLKENPHKMNSDDAAMFQKLSSDLYSGKSLDPMQVATDRDDLLQRIRNQPHMKMRGQHVAPRIVQREGAISISVEECFKDLLDWIWTFIVSPVYTALRSVRGRLWWLPTGEFTGLPLHASSPDGYFVHSYTATLGSLLDAYAKRGPGSLQTFGIVGVAFTDASLRNFLPSVKQEVENIIHIVRKAVKCLTDKNATVDAVQQQLRESSWVHLACHGEQDLRDPTKSKLLLFEGNLELDTILRMDLPRAQFAFLAACQTAMGDVGLINESFHLGGGFIAAGFCGAVGTLWSMHDPDGPVVAKEFYSRLFQGSRQPSASDAAEALHLTVKAMKNRGVPYQRWVPFIHMGI
ncbi:CHAT domain-containing protein, partial [Mycena leptocephala]